MRLRIGSQNLSLRGLPPIGRPMYIKGIFPTLQLNTFAASFNKESEIFIPTIADDKKLKRKRERLKRIK
ncbi:hypothetical protein MTR_5g018450 [Medicago truncatula]|uniref:Uncharacterized protein n=1 Tax=Medicago truncatula TaxID=3880 RepID=G7K9F3_MEDTR|nr:hypothetical protein MTR_5g018450 [Medicago truncatula]